MSVRIFNLAAFVFLIQVLFSSCKKNEDFGSPIVTILKPSSGASFAVGDTFPIQIHISDSKQITAVGIRLLNSNYIPAGHGVSSTFSGNNTVINAQYVIDNVNLVSGNYYIAVTASNGHHETNAYTLIHINELQKVRKAIYLISSANNFSCQVLKIDSLHQPSISISIPGDYAASAIYSLGNTLFTIGKLTGNFNGYDLTSNALLFSKQSAASSIPTFMNLFLENDVVYVSWYNGNIKGYNKTGTQKYEVQQSGYFIPDAILKNDQYFFGELYYPTVHETRIGSFYLVSGAAKQERVIDMDLKNMFTLDNGHLLLFGNDTVSGQGKIEIYNETGNGIIQLHTVPTGLLNNVVQVDNTHYFVAHSGGIYLYNYTLNGLTPFVTGFPVYSLTYDDLDQEIFACSGNTVHVYNSSTASFQYNIANTDSVKDVRLLFSK